MFVGEYDVGCQHPLSKPDGVKTAARHELGTDGFMLLALLLLFVLIYVVWSLVVYFLIRTCPDLRLRDIGGELTGGYVKSGRQAVRRLVLVGIFPLLGLWYIFLIVVGIRRSDSNDTLAAALCIGLIIMIPSWIVLSYLIADGAIATYVLAVSVERDYRDEH